MRRGRGAAVAAAMKAAKGKGSKRSKSSKKDHTHKSHHHHAIVEDDPLRDFLQANSNSDEMFGKRVLMLEKIFAHKHATDKVVISMTDRTDIQRQRQIDGMSHLVESRLERNSNYTSAFCLMVFFLVSCSVLVAQRDVPESFLVEGALFYNILGDLEVDKELTRSDEFYDWFEANLVDRVFTDPACGDGVCDFPDEYPGFGRFGCIPDCGRYKKTTKVTVVLEDFVEYSKSVQGMMHEDNGKASDWDMSPVVNKLKDIHPDFRWNIWSDTMGDYIFAEAQAPVASGDKVVVDLPDGRNELRFFQHRKVSEEVDPATIFAQLYMLPTTLPKRTVTSDFSYGDKFEAISGAAIFMRQINDYCFSGMNDPVPKQCSGDSAIPVVDTMFKAMGSYGLSGKITMPNPKSKAKPPEPTVLASVGFCGLLKNGTQGLKNRFNKLNFQDAGMDCGNRRAGERMLRLSTEHPDWDVSVDDSSVPKRNLMENTAIAHLQQNITDASSDNRHLLQVAGTSPRYGICVAHGDCNQAVADSVTAHPGQFCSRQWGCDTCSFCQIDGADAINGLCPKAYCPDSGELPGCVSALKLTREWECPDTTEFSIWTYHSKGETVVVTPPGEPKLRYVTPFNRLVGPIVISQKRRIFGNCSKVVNPFIKSWASGGLNGADGCLQGENDLDSEFFGLDTAFVPTTELYDGNLVPEDYYARHERLNKTISESTSRGVAMVTLPSVPLGFYPYKYDLVNHTMRVDGTYRSDQADTFKLYFDTQITQGQAKNMLSYMKEGGYIDGHTSNMEIQLITFNAEFNRFTLIRFNFDWTSGGSITWDYWVESVVLDVYDLPTGTSQLAFEIIVLIMFGVNVILELVDIFVAARANKIGAYIMNVGNLFDWLHFAFMGVCIGLWFNILHFTEAFTMTFENYPVLYDPYAGARVFAVDTAREEEYLQFQEEILVIASMLRLYNAFAGTTVILFVFRILKALDFQPIMGIVTRTLWAASADMAHFVVLFSLITFGYAFAAVLLFGHQFGGTVDVISAFMLLIDVILVMDTGVFWEQMEHACDYTFFSLFIWSWIIVGFFLLINIFIAIVIDSYINVKEENTSRTGMHEELSMMMTDWWKQMTKPRSQYMNDATLYKILQEKKMGLPSSYQLREAVMESMEEDVGIVLEEGVVINRHSMRRILRGPVDVEILTGEKDAKVEGADEEGALQDSSDDEEDINWQSVEEECIVEDLMERYAAGERGEEDQILDAMRVDSMKRAVALFRHQQWMNRKLKHSSEVCERLALRIVPASKQAIIAKQAAAMKAPPKDSVQSRGLLRVTVVEATNLPKLDLLRASDPYCLVFLTDEAGEPGEIVYRTEVVPHSSNPIFNEEFLFSLHNGVADVCVLIYDDDHITEDDLIGSVQVNLESLDPWVPTERWCQVRNSAREDQGIKEAKMRLQLTLQPANADLDIDSSIAESVKGTNGLHRGAPPGAGPAAGPAGEAFGNDSLRLTDVHEGDRSIDGMEAPPQPHPFAPNNQ